MLGILECVTKMPLCCGWLQSPAISLILAYEVHFCYALLVKKCGDAESMEDAQIATHHDQTAHSGFSVLPRYLTEIYIHECRCWPGVTP